MSREPRLLDGMSLDSADTELSPVLIGTWPSVSTKDGIFFDQLSDRFFLKKNSAPWN
jgi:hypothetical protein